MKCMAIQEDVVILRRVLDPEIFRVEMRALAIDSVTRDGVANVTQVDPNLVGSSRVGRPLEIGKMSVRAKASVLRVSFFEPLTVGGKLRASGWVPSQGYPYFTFLAAHAFVHQG